MQHIGIDARLTYYRIGGISTYIKRLILALEILDTNHHYTVFDSRKSGNTLTHRFQQSKLWTPCHHRFEPVSLSAELLRFNLDLLHSPDFIPPLRGARQHIITIHDLNFLHYPQFLTAESRRYYNDQIERAVQQADHILADSEATKQDLVNMLAVPAEKITVHMLGVDESFRPLPLDDLVPVRQQLDLPDAYVLFLGTFEPRKNVKGLLDAYRLLRNEFPQAPPLVLAGTRGWLFDETMAHVDALKLAPHVLWRENISQKDLPALYNMASVLVLPSFYEGFGFPALEAMACGTVPVVSNRSSLPEVVGDVGLQVNPDNPVELAKALQHALSDQDWRMTMQQAGLARAATFTWERTAHIALSAYQRLLD
ncbi:MAG: glycosyltransferase family 4 protein [Anaerolineae bacterium]|nr:glycosyltransferase family 4 protein [Anaerolineae bacterium]